MPQASINFGLTASLLEGAIVQLTYRYYDLYFSDWSPTSREYSDGDTPDRVDIWIIPAYSIVDLNASYDITFENMIFYLLITHSELSFNKNLNIPNFLYKRKITKKYIKTFIIKKINGCMMINLIGLMIISPIMLLKIEIAKYFIGIKSLIDILK